jgi:putative hemolysin
MLELLIIIALIFINGILSLSEMALVSSRKSKLQQMAMEGDDMAKKVLDITKVPTNYLSTVQVGITMTGILAGVFSGATIADEIALWLGRYAPIRPYSPVISFFLVVITVTYLSLIFGELLPKRIALQNPEKNSSMDCNVYGDDNAHSFTDSWCYVYVY